VGWSVGEGLSAVESGIFIVFSCVHYKLIFTCLRHEGTTNRPPSKSAAKQTAAHLASVNKAANTHTHTRTHTIVYIAATATPTALSSTRISNFTSLSQKSPYPPHKPLPSAATSFVWPTCSLTDRKFANFLKFSQVQRLRRPR